MIEVLAACAFAGLLVYAAGSDVARLIIPNWVSIAMAGLFFPVALLSGATLPEIGLHALFAASILVVGFFLFAAKIIGGGDAKLLAATSIWTGFAAFAPFIFWTAIAGGLMAAALLAARQWVPQTETHPAFVNRLLSGKSGIPYGVAIMIGGLMALPSIPHMSISLTMP